MLLFILDLILQFSISSSSPFCRRPWIILGSRRDLSASLLGGMRVPMVTVRLAAANGRTWMDIEMQKRLDPISRRRLIFEHRSDRLTKKMSRKQKEHRLLLVEVPFLRKQEYLNDRNKAEKREDEEDECKKRG
ncbi:uncharacterized protein LOC105662151 isoform X2 [Megachile rotundata]|uniref:uncharacterized protein LOC105662151 isoform X2 n=1 Tax=Megachile rotundata TaxID=143995 RepID=UPI003FD2B248